MSSREASETGDPPVERGVQVKRAQIPRNLAYIEVRRRASSPQGGEMSIKQQMGIFRQPYEYLILVDV
jgi:hypothetical protein